MRVRSFLHSKMYIATLVTFLHAFVILLSASGETRDFGGWDERFKGAGDKIPPSCQINAPNAAQKPFFIKWYCSDDNAPDKNIRTEIWIYRKGSLAGELVRSYLGFPASLQVDAGLLKADTVKDGLPAAFKLVATDQAGITTVSPLVTVDSQGSGFSTCSLTVALPSTQSSDDQTGSPKRTVFVKDAAVSAIFIGSKSLLIETKEAVVASPCEIDSICEDDKKVNFSASVLLEDESAVTTSTSAPTTTSITDDDELTTASNESLESLTTTTVNTETNTETNIGTSFGQNGVESSEQKTATAVLTVVPSNTVVEMKGTLDLIDGNVVDVALAGVADIDGEKANVQLECQQ